MENGGFRPKLVVIGAGIAGLAAAQYLVNHNGPCDVLILEANDRVGGRIWTGEKSLDYGAQFIHGRDNNPIYKIASERGLIADTDSKDSSSPDSEDSSSDEESDDDEERYLFFMQNGNVIPLSVAREVCTVLDEILEEGNKFSRENISCDDESVGTFVHREFYKYLRTSSDTEEVKLMKEGIFNWRLLQEKTDNACKSVFEMSLYAWGEYLECSGARYLEFKKGFSGVIDAIAEDLPKNMIHLNKPVKRIVWDQPTSRSFSQDFSDDVNQPDVAKELSVASGPFYTQPKVTIHTADGSVISADYVLVTCSLGVLKRSAHDLFRPLLPSNKLAVINRMGFGTVDKIYLEFEEAFWDKDCDGIQFAWSSDEELVLDKTDNKFQIENLRKDWFRGIQGFDTLYGHPNILEGWIAGEEAEVMETLPDEVVLEICYELLKRFTNNSEMQKPTRLIRSRWHSEPHILGSYSYIKLGHQASDCDLLAQPVTVKQEPRLMFAGEHTHKQYFSTTHGALLSGQREAQRLMDHLAKLSKPCDDAANALPLAFEAKLSLNRDQDAVTSLE